MKPNRLVCNSYAIKWNGDFVLNFMDSNGVNGTERAKGVEMPNQRRYTLIVLFVRSFGFFMVFLLSYRVQQVIAKFGTEKRVSNGLHWSRESNKFSKR